MTDFTTYKALSPANGSKIPGIRLTLVPYNRSTHLDELWDALGGAEGINEQLKYFPNDDFAAPGDLGDWLDSANKSGLFVTYIAVDRASKVIGMASYMRIDTKNGVIEVGSVAHGPAMARSPLSTEMHYLLGRNAFEALKYRRYEWKCHNANQPSKKAAVRYGFTFEGVFRQHMISRGKNRDTAWFSIIDQDWPLVREAFEAWLDPSNFDVDGKQVRKLEDIRAALGKDREEVAGNKESSRSGSTDQCEQKSNLEDRWSIGSSRPST